VRPDLPHVEQSDPFGCGAACGEMAAKVHGVDTSQAEILAHPGFNEGVILNGKYFGRGYNTIPLGRAMEALAPVKGRTWRGMDVYPPNEKNPPARSVEWHRDIISATLKRGGGVFIARYGLDHWIIVDGVAGDKVHVRDPAAKAPSEIPIEHFRAVFTGDVVIAEPQQ
jgi:ABC-type bacteriocin/lantibiotic exporter with double-glycine peptidase domain